MLPKSSVILGESCAFLIQLVFETRLRFILSQNININVAFVYKYVCVFLCVYMTV